MSPKSIVRISNIIGIVSIVLLVYWVFIFILNEVFELRVFRQNMTEIFLMSILGIISLMFGALIVNIMYNLTRIAQKLNNDNEQFSATKSKKIGVLFLCTFPLIAAFLFFGNHLSKRKKESVLVQAAEKICQANEKEVSLLANYQFNEPWLYQASNFLEIISKTDTDIPSIEVVVKDSINNVPVYLSVRNYYRSESDSSFPLKKDYIYKCKISDRKYLDDVFQNKTKSTLFKSNGGNYELYFPVNRNGKIFVFYLSDYMSYGKLGS